MNKVNKLLEANVTKRGEPRVIKHDITFQMRVVVFEGKPIDDDSKHNRALMDGDEDLYVQVPREVSNWMYRDHDGIEGERLGVYQPEFGYDESQPDSESLYDISVCASHALPDLRSQTTDERPISIEQLVEELPPIIQRIYSAKGVTLELHRVTFHQVLESSLDGNYEISKA